MNQCLYCRWVFFFISYFTEQKNIAGKSIQTMLYCHMSFCQSYVMTSLYRWLKTVFKTLLLFSFLCYNYISREIICSGWYLHGYKQNASLQNTITTIFSSSVKASFLKPAESVSATDNVADISTDSKAQV